MWKMKIVLMIVITMIVLLSGLFCKENWVPGKCAIKTNEFINYKPYILVQEVHYTGTGWVQTGDDNGCYLPEEYVDVNINNGNILPQMEMYNKGYVNTFLCKVEYKGKIKHEAFEKEIDSYDVLEWYPVYPVLRDTFLPEWMYPNNFLTKQECSKYETKE